MMTDIQGFTARTSDSTRQDLADLIDEHERLLSPVFSHFDGRIIKTLGDAFLVVFDSPTDAVLCGLTVQEVLRQHNEKAKQKLSVRVAINVGDVNLIDSDILGEPVNIVARLEAITEAGEVWFTEAVYLSMNRKEVPSSEVGERTFKGIPFPIRVYKVINDPESFHFRQIAESVRFTQKGPVIKGLRSQIHDPNKKKNPIKGLWLYVGGTLLTLIIAIFIYLSMDRWEFEQKIQAYIASEEYRAAYDMTEKAIELDPLDEKLKTWSIQLAELEVQKLKDRQDIKTARDWLKSELDAHVYLDSLTLTFLEIDTIYELNERMTGSVNERELWSWVREQIHKKGAGAEIPLLIARKFEERFIPEVRIWLYDLAFQRGIDAKALNVWEDCKKVLTRNHSGSNYSKDALEFSRLAYKESLDSWISKTIQSGGNAALGNAIWATNLITDQEISPTLKALAIVTEAERQNVEDFNKAVIFLKAENKSRLKAIIQGKLNDGRYLGTEWVARLKATLED